MFTIENAKVRITDDMMFRTLSGPLAIVRVCNDCGFKIVLRRRTGVGRGYGFREGNKARGVMIQHYKKTHDGQILNQPSPAKLERSRLED